MVQSDNRRLKNLFINKGLQFRIIMTSLVYMFLVMVVTTGAIIYPDLYTMFTSQDLGTQYQAAQNFLVLARRIVPSTVFLFFLFFIHQLVMTHRICGPLVNFTSTFKKIGDGDFSKKVTIRKGDYLKAECEAINTMIENLSRKFQVIAEDHDRVIRILEQSLTNIADEPARKSIEDLLNGLKEKSRIPVPPDEDGSENRS
jgi:methyl-accepting chemotaxis protein